jgi:hypothetical protein
LVYVGSLLQSEKVIKCNRIYMNAHIWVSWKPYSLQRNCIGHKFCI